MKKVPGLVILLILIVGLMNSCKKDKSCPEILEVGQLFWSAETENWFPSKYLNQPSTLKFESEDGDVIEFELNHSTILEANFRTFVMECENEADSTFVLWADRRYSGRYLTQDSLAISIGIGVKNEKSSLDRVVEADFFEWILISIYRLNDGTADHFGSLKIITDLRNSELEEINYFPSIFEVHNTFEFIGDEYTEVYCDSEPDFLNSNIYFQRGIGMIGFKDENGLKWKVID